MKTKSFVWDGSDEEGLSKKVKGDALKNKFTFTQNAKKIMEDC